MPDHAPECTHKFHYRTVMVTCADCGHTEAYALPLETGSQNATLNEDGSSPPSGRVSTVHADSKRGGNVACLDESVPRDGAATAEAPGAAAGANPAPSIASGVV